MLLVLFNPYIGPYQVLPLRARVDLEAMAMKGYSAFPKAPALLEPYHQIIYCHIRTLVVGGVSYPSAEKQSVYSTAPADWARLFFSFLAEDGKEGSSYWPKDIRLFRCSSSEVALGCLLLRVIFIFIWSDFFNRKSQLHQLKINRNRNHW